jgi:MFS family permease
MSGTASGLGESVRRHYVLFLLFLVSMLNYVDRTIVSVLQVPIKGELGLTDAQLGALTGLSFALFYSTLSLPIARWADIYMRKRIIAAALAIWSGMTALTGLATSYLSLVGYRIGVGIGEAGSIPASQSIIADLYPPRSRATVLAIWGLSLPAGMAFGYLCAGALAEAVGWRMTFAVIGIAGLLLAPLVLLTMPEPLRGRLDPPAAVAAATPSMTEVLKKLWRLRTYRLLLLGGALHGYAQYSVMSWSAPFYTRVFGMSLTEVSAWLALLSGVGSAVGMYFGGWLSDYCGMRDPRGRLRAIAVTIAICAPCAMVQFLADSVATSLIFGVIASTLMISYYGPIVAVPQLLVPPGMRAFTSAVLLLVFNLIGLGLGPFVTGLVSDVLADRYGWVADSLRYALSSAMVLSLIGAALFWRASRYLPAELLSREDVPHAAEHTARIHTADARVAI